MVLAPNANKMCIYYRLQQSSGEVIFLQASVILFTGGACMGGLEACVAGGHMWQGGMHGRRNGMGVLHGIGGMHGRGACVAGGHVWQRACMAGGMHGRGHAWQGVCVVGGACGRGACIAGDMCGRRACVAGVYTWQGGVHGSGGMHGRGYVWQGGASMAGGHAWQGVCVAGGIYGRVHAWQRGCAWWGLCGRGAWMGACLAGKMATPADGMHPTGVHACFNIKY